MVNGGSFLKKRSRTQRVDHIVTKVISFYLFEARHFQPFLYPSLIGSLSSHFPWDVFPYDTWTVP